MGALSDVPAQLSQWKPQLRLGLGGSQLALLLVTFTPGIPVVVSDADSGQQRRCWVQLSLGYRSLICN